MSEQSKPACKITEVLHLEGKENSLTESLQSIPLTRNLRVILIHTRWEGACSPSGQHALRCVHHAKDLGWVKMYQQETAQFTGSQVDANLL